MRRKSKQKKGGGTPKSFPKVEVFWTDAASTDDWEDLESVLADKEIGAPCSTIGFLVHRSKKGVKLYSTQGMSRKNGATAQMCMCMEIPASFIVRIKRLG